MKEIQKLGAQGDVMLRKIDKLPADAVAVPRKGAIVIAHSETGHHHVITDKGVTLFEVAGRPLVAYLRFEKGNGGSVDVVHKRQHDTHETLRLLGKVGDVWEVRRQRESTPGGWQRVAD